MDDELRDLLGRDVHGSDTNDGHPAVGPEPEVGDRLSVSRDGLAGSPPEVTEQNDSPLVLRQIGSLLHLSIPILKPMKTSTLTPTRLRDSGSSLPLLNPLERATRPDSVSAFYTIPSRAAKCHNNIFTSAEELWPIFIILLSSVNSRVTSGRSEDRYCGPAARVAWFRKEIKMARTTKSDEELVQRVLEGGKKVQRAFAKWRETRDQNREKGERPEQRSSRS